MITLRGDMKQAFDNGIRNYYAKVYVYLKDENGNHSTSADFVFDNDEISQGDFSLEDAVNTQDALTIGSAIVNQCVFSIADYDGNYINYNFEGAMIDVYVGLYKDLIGTESTESIRKGKFYIEDVKYDQDSVAFTCYDSMHKFDKDYSLSPLAYPATIKQIVMEACNTCHVDFESNLSFITNNFTVNARPSTEGLTYRQIIAWAAQTQCCFARINRDNKLYFGWFTYISSDVNEASLDGGNFLYSGREDSADGNGTNAIDGGLLFDGSGFVIRDCYSKTISAFPVNITKVSVIETNIVTVTETESETDEEGNVTTSTTTTEKEETSNFSFGNDGYEISISGNDLIKNGNGQSVLNLMKSKVLGMTYRQANVNFSADPTIEAGDVGFVVDNQNRYYPVIASIVAFNFNGASTLNSSAETPTRNNANAYNENTRNIAKLKQQVESNKTDVDLKIAEFQRKISESKGMYVTTGDDNIIYLHDQPVFAESTNIIKITSGGVAFSSDGGETYLYGITLNGEAILNYIGAKGITAEYIKVDDLTLGGEFEASSLEYPNAIERGDSSTRKAFAITVDDNYESQTIQNEFEVLIDVSVGDSIYVTCNTPFRVIQMEALDDLSQPLIESAFDEAKQAYVTSFIARPEILVYVFGVTNFKKGDPEPTYSFLVNKDKVVAITNTRINENGTALKTTRTNTITGEVNSTFVSADRIETTGEVIGKNTVKPMFTSRWYSGATIGPGQAIVGNYTIPKDGMYLFTYTQQADVVNINSKFTIAITENDTISTAEYGAISTDIMLNSPKSLHTSRVEYFRAGTVVHFIAHCDKTIHLGAVDFKAVFLTSLSW